MRKNSETHSKKIDELIGYISQWSCSQTIEIDKNSLKIAHGLVQKICNIWRDDLIGKSRPNWREEGVFKK